MSAWQLNLPGGGRVQYNDGVLRIRTPQAESSILPDALLQIASDAKPTPETLASIVNRDTGTIKGNGAFCVQPLSQHTFLGFYQGKRVTTNTMDDNGPNETNKTRQFGQSLPNEYIMALDGGVTFLDGQERAQDRSVFTPAHLNHAKKTDRGCNCLRILTNDNTNVAFFTARDVEAGEELCFDYGDAYWEGRRQDEII